MVIARGCAASIFACLPALVSAFLFAGPARAEGEGLMTARRIACAPESFLQCRDWWWPCRLATLPPESRGDRLRFDLAEKRAEVAHARGVAQLGMVIEDRVEAAGRILVVIRRPELRHRAVVFTIARNGALFGTGDEGRFEMRGVCQEE